MSISHVGATGFQEFPLAGPYAITYTTQAVGDVVIISGRRSLTDGFHVTAVTDTSSRITWQAVEDFVGNTYEYMCWGTVTSAGSTNITLTLNGTTTTTTEVNVDEFQSSTGSSTVWTRDGALGTATSTATTITWAALTPAGGGELFYGHGRSGGTITLPSPNPTAAGDTYYTNPNGNAVVYNLGFSAHSVSTAQTSAAFTAIDALFKAAIAGDAPTGQLTLAGSVAENFTLGDQILRPSSDIATAGWTNTPLFSKINDSSDGTFITATLA